MDIDFMKSFGKAAEFYVRGGPLYVQSVCFSRCGQYMASSHTNNILTIINVDVGEIGGQDQYCHKYGTGIVRYPAQLTNRVLLTSTQTDDSVRELDLERSEYSRVFKGHTKTVLSLETSANDAFVTSSEDGTVRLWDTRSQRVRDVIGELRQPVANISAAGNTIIVGNDSETIQLYDVRMLQQGLFRDFRVPTNLHSKWASVEVSNDDRLVAVATNDHFVHMANMDNNDVHTFRSRDNKEKVKIGVTFSSDNKYLLSGGSGGKITVWSVDTKTVVVQLTDGTDCYTSVVYHPFYTIFATGAKTTQIWAPENKTDDDAYV